ncbi:hypothetical protein D9753_21900 [Streptomyces dangxiongensis]|uniref:Lipoprotein n=1 Tax=Streptomyces dangxiongensis TaxID=1442032 RepID=A0A3G2JFF1_9ACTN|nr:hypothetical protein [Streptomyces dangxiongensis]AYN41088.1 hypothetical protein D9753_21900 [Streptomyces dangxiongensis]
MKTKARFALAAGVALACLTACSGPGSSEAGGGLHVEADYAYYSSAEDVSSVAEIAVTGPVLSIETRECDKGGDNAGEPAIDPTEPDSTDPNPDPSATSSPDPTVTPSGIAGDGPGTADCTPMVFLKVRVAGMMKRGGGVNDGDEIIVGNIDTDKVTMEGATPLTVGKQYALYLRQLTASDHPGITSVQNFWIPVGGSQGVFVVAKGTVTPASANIVALTNTEARKKLSAASGKSRPERLHTTVAGLRKAAKVAAAAERRSASR